MDDTVQNPPQGSLADAMKNVNDLRGNIAPWRDPTPTEDYSRMLKVGTGRRPFIAAGGQYVAMHPEYLPGTIKRDELKTQYDDWQQLDALCNALDAVYQEVRKAWYGQGTRLYNMLRMYERTAADAGRQGDATGKAIAADMAEKRPMTGRPRQGNNDAETQTSPQQNTGTEAVSVSV
jgi:hypothetical protein